MTSRDQRDGRVQDVRELLAAYADGGLEGDEHQQVEAYLAQHPGAELELEELREVLRASRAAQPSPGEPPAWDQMARAIRSEIDDAPASPTLWTQIKETLRPRYVAPVMVAVCAAAVFVILRSGQGTRADPPPPIVSHSSEKTEASEIEQVAAGDGELALRAPEVDELADEELDSLYDNLAPESLLAEQSDDDQGDDGEPAEIGAASVLSDEIVAEWTEANDDTAPSADDDDLGLFDEPDYTDFVNSLSEAELNQLAAYLAEETG